MKSLKYVVFSMLLATPALSDAAIGTITDQVNAPPSITREKSTLTGAKGTGVEMNDAVRTAGGKVGITFEDQTKVQITENSKLVIDEFVYDPKNKSTGKLAMKVALGTVRYASGAIAHNDPKGVAINTPSATIGVRGTDFTATVDEVGATTVILLPSCPNNRRERNINDIEQNCKIGEITVTSDAGQVILNKPFQATKVENRGMRPSPPVILKLSEIEINNMLIVSPPNEVRKQEDTRVHAKGALDVDFLKETGLTNVLDAERKEQFKDRLSTNFLDQNFLQNVLDLINAQLAAQINLLNTTTNSLLPDYNAITGVVATVDDTSVNLTRADGSNTSSITVPKNQNSTILQTQGSIEVKNRVNSGNNTYITVVQDASPPTGLMVPKK